MLTEDARDLGRRMLAVDPAVLDLDLGMPLVILSILGLEVFDRV